MHKSSYENMRRFVENHLAGQRGAPLAIADIGSQDVNGSYQPLFDDEGWSYTGVDMAPGRNVDVVLADIYAWDELETGAFDVVVSGQAFEHIEYFWLTMLEVARIMRPGGVCCLVAPSSGFEHRYPVDCWRFYPDGMRALARYAGLEVLEAYAEWDKEKYPTRDATWQDCVLVARKPIDGQAAAGPGGARPRPVSDRPVQEEPTRPAPVAAEPSSETRFALERLAEEGNPAGVQHWHLDSPRHETAAESLGEDRFMLRGWALSRDGAPVHVAVEIDGEVKCHPMNTRRADVIQSILKQDPVDHPRLHCGFELPLPASRELRYGFEVGSRITWIHRLRRL